MDGEDCEIIVWKEPPANDGANDGLNAKQRRKQKKRAEGLASGKHTSPSAFSAFSVRGHSLPLAISSSNVSFHAPKKAHAHGVSQPTISIR